MDPLPEAIAYVERGIDRCPWSPGLRGLHAGLRKKNREPERSQQLAATFGDPAEYGGGLDYALYHLASGDTDQAFDCLHLLSEQRHPLLIMILVGGPYGRTLRAWTRWASFAPMVGLTHLLAPPPDPS